MADHKATSAAGSDAEVFLSASEDESVQQEITPELLSALVKQVWRRIQGSCAPFWRLGPAICSAPCSSTRPTGSAIYGIRP